jgi:YVTN family beta-propeller protein
MRVYVTNDGSNTVSVIDTATNSIVATVAVGGNPRSWGLFIGPEVIRAEVAASSPIPTLSEWGVIMLSSLVALGTFLTLGRRRS